MEDEICQHSKYGFCKYKDSCKRKHFGECCNDMSNCQLIKAATKDTPNHLKDLLQEAVDSKVNVLTAIKMLQKSRRNVN